MNDSGLYQLFINLAEDKLIKVGKLGEFKFIKGLYIYTGSARNGLQARVSRHLSKRKRLHWHIDYLLKQSYIEEARLYYTPSFSECVLNLKTFKQYTNAIYPVKGFGSSDCSCISHLIYVEKALLKSKYND